jgi:molybdopterin/thiamine biosynthesis adenylyltransferase
VTIRLDIAGSDYAALHRHLFQRDRDEHGAVLLAGVRERHGGLVLLTREMHFLDGPEFPAGDYGYRQFPPHVLARLGSRAAAERLAFVSCHSHPGSGSRVGLSRDDLDAHRRVFPHMLDIVDGPPIAGLAFGEAGVAGELWRTGHQPVALDAVRIVGETIRTLTPRPAAAAAATEERFDRQARMFGASGQQILRRLRVGVVGLGGGGSMIVEQLAHLGVGAIVGIDFDIVKTHNLSRIIGATRRDARRHAKKVAVAHRVVTRIDDRIEFEAVDGDIADAPIAERLLDCDFFFLATDSATSRLVANAITQAHFVPMVQIGAKVDLRASGALESIYVAVRPVFPGSGCLDCAGLIDPVALQEEAASPEERRAQNYLNLPDVIDPSVVTLNGLGASTAVNTMLMASVGLADDRLLRHRLLDARTGDWLPLAAKKNPSCRWCGSGPTSRFGRGDASELPLRRTAEVRYPVAWSFRSRRRRQ